MALHLRAARVNAGLTQSDTVREMQKMGYKLSKNTLINYEKYRTKPDIDTAKALAVLYGLTVDDIIFFTQ